MPLIGNTIYKAFTAVLLKVEVFWDVALSLGSGF
jgi:hypothetical protein